jgi:hypothetical protein
MSYMVICEKIYDIRVINNASTCYLYYFVVL